MKRWLTFLLAIALAGMSTREAFALGNDFTKEQLAAAGKHCVHGFWVNLQNVLFFAGDTDQLNLDLPKYLNGDFASRKIVLHVGTKRAESPWDKKPRDTFADWSVNTWDDPDDAAKATPRFRLQIDIWLGRTIELENLRIPEAFEVVSGGEIERFVQKRKKESK